MTIALLKKIGRAVILLLCFALIIRYFATHREQLDILTGIRWPLTVLLFFLYAVIHGLHALKIFVILRRTELSRLRFRDWFRIYIVSRFLNFYIVQGTNLYGGFQLKKRYAFAYAKMVSAIAFTSWFDTLVNLGITTGFLVALGTSIEVGGAPLPSLLGGIAVIVLFLPFLAQIFSRSLNFRGPRLGWLQERWNTMLRHLIINIRDSRLLSKVLLLSIAQFLLVTSWIAICSRAINSPFGTGEVFLFTCVMMLSRTVNIVPNNLGVTELITGYFAEFLGYSVGVGIIIAGILRIINYVVVALLSVVAIKSEKQMKIPGDLPEENL